MLDDLYAADNEALINDMVARPAPAPKQSPKFSAWKTTTAAPRGVAAGANESAGFMADVLGAFGQTMAATDARSGGMFSAQSDDERKQEAAARDKMRQGIDMSSEAGDDFRSTAKSFMPDPESAHTAESLVFGLGRFATKAVGYSVTAGPVVGAGLTGLDEGMTTASELKTQGVDIETRTAVGAVAGMTSAASVVLPVAGKTLAQTAGLVAAGGPGAFIGQQVATRQILQDANYDDLASQYDPLDPVGLAVATLVPAGFGAFALRGAARRAKAKPDVSLKVSEDAPPPEAETQAPRPTREQADAARVELLSEHVDRAGLHAPEDAAGAAAHQTAIAKAIDQMSRGERVEVADVAPVPREIPKMRVEEVGGPSGQRNAAITAMLDGKPAGRLDFTEYDGTPAISMVEVSPEARRRGVGSELVKELQRIYPDAPIDWGMMTDEGAALRKSLPTITKLREDIAAARSELERATSERAALERKAEEFNAIENPSEAQRADYRAWIDEVGGRWNDLHDKIDDLEQKVQGQPDNLQLIDTRNPLRDFAGAIERSIAPTQGQPDGNPGNTGPVADRQGAAGGADAGAGVADRGRGADGSGSSAMDPTPGQPGAPERAPGAGSDGNPRAQAVAEQAAKTRLAEIGKQFPDLEVQMDGMDGPVKLSDFLAEVQREADAEIKDAPLLQAAAECFLTFGL